MRVPQINIYLLMGAIFWIMAVACYYFAFPILWWEIRPFTILTVPCALIGSLIFVYGLSQMRKTGGGRR